jgi:hypothetical protein
MFVVLLQALFKAASDSQKRREIEEADRALALRLQQREDNLSAVSTGASGSEPTSASASASSAFSASASASAAALPPTAPPPSKVNPAPNHSLDSLSSNVYAVFCFVRTRKKW